MAKYQFKFLVFETRPKVMFGFKHTVAQVDVSMYNKKGINQLWDELLKTYPSEIFLSCLTETNSPMREFKEDPNDERIQNLIK